MTDWQEVEDAIKHSVFDELQKSDLRRIVIAIHKDTCGWTKAEPEKKRPKTKDWVVTSSGELKKISIIKFEYKEPILVGLEDEAGLRKWSDVRLATREEMFKPGALVWFGKDKKFLQTKLEKVEDGVVYFEAFDWKGRNIERSITDPNLKLIEPAPQ